jgi:stearoyl-CoA desaturase (delta-9 desaturase)
MIDINVISFCIVTLIYWHVFTLSMTLYIHRYTQHRSYKISKPLEIFFKHTIWFISGQLDLIGARERHLYHHKTSDTNQDPHSPSFIPKYNLLVLAPLKMVSNTVVQMIKTPLRSHVYDYLRNEPGYDYMYVYPFSGLLIFLSFNIFLFGWIGIFLSLSVLFLSWFSMITAGWGLSHLYGYQNFDTKDKSKNIFPIGLIFAGEELHNNHHKYPRKINLAVKWYEFDLGYWYLVLFSKMKLCDLTK